MVINQLLNGMILQVRESPPRCPKPSGFGIIGKFAQIYVLLGQWLTGFKLLGIPYLVGKMKFKLLFQGPLAKWDV